MERVHKDLLRQFTNCSRYGYVCPQFQMELRYQSYFAKDCLQEKSSNPTIQTICLMLILTFSLPLIKSPNSTNLIHHLTLLLCKKLLEQDLVLHLTFSFGDNNALFHSGTVLYSNGFVV